MDLGWIKYLEAIDKRLENIEKSVASLRESHWRAVGGIVVVSGIAGLLFQFLIVWFTK